MKKKTLALTMAMALVLSLAACGNSNADVAAESTAAATTEAGAYRSATTEVSYMEASFFFLMRLLKLLLMRSPRVL